MIDIETFIFPGQSWPQTQNCCCASSGPSTCGMQERTTLRGCYGLDYVWTYDLLRFPRGIIEPEFPTLKCEKEQLVRKWAGVTGGLCGQRGGGEGALVVAPGKTTIKTLYGKTRRSPHLGHTFSLSPFSSQTHMQKHTSTHTQNSSWMLLNQSLEQEITLPGNKLHFKSRQRV